MDAVICDISALLFWRTPPIARLLAAGPEDDPLMRSMAEPARLSRMREDLAAAAPLAAAMREASGSSRLGPAARAICESEVLLATRIPGPVDVLALSPGERRPSALVRPRLMSAPPPREDCRRVGERAGIVSPATALQQVAARASLNQAIMLLTELLGTFSVYRPPEPLGALLQELANARLLVPHGRWSPALDNSGRLTGIWSRPPLLTAAGLGRHLEETGSSRGRAKLELALRHALPGAASPFEVQAEMLLGLGPRLGGEGYEGLVLNKRVDLSRDAAALAGRRACFCDLFWPGAPRSLDVECQSVSHHFGGASSVSDANRATALGLMGIDVVQLTYGQLADPRKFEIFSRHVAEKLGVSYHEKSAFEQRKHEELRRDLLVDWEKLPLLL